jgi:hypothetical protein
MTTLFRFPREQAFGTTGAISAGAKLYFYAATTTTPQNTYSDSTLVTPNANPVVADSSGLFGPIFLSVLSYYVELKTSAGVTIWTQDNVDNTVAAAAAIATEDYVNTNTTRVGMRTTTSASIYNQTNAEDMLVATHNAGVDLYYNNVKTLYTADRTASGNSSGATILDGGGTPRPVGFNTFPFSTQDATYTFLQAQTGMIIYHTSASAHTYTTPASTVTQIPSGAWWKVLNVGAGVVSIAAGAGVTLSWLTGAAVTQTTPRSLALGGQFLLVKFSDTSYLLIEGYGLT